MFLTVAVTGQPYELLANFDSKQQYNIFGTKSFKCLSLCFSKLYKKQIRFTVAGIVVQTNSVLKLLENRGAVRKSESRPGGAV